MEQKSAKGRCMYNPTSVMLCADQEREWKGVCSVHPHVLSGLHTEVVWHQTGAWQLT